MGIANGKCEVDLALRIDIGIVLTTHQTTLGIAQLYLKTGSSERLAATAC